MMKAILLVAALMVAVVHSEKIENCKDMPKSKNKNLSPTLEKYSLLWSIFINSKPETESCLKCAYNITSNETPIVGTVILFNIMKNVRWNITLTDHSDFSGWNVVGGDPSPIDFYIAAFDADVPYMCAYTCDSDGIKINHFRCLTTSEEGYKKMHSYLANKMPDWPFKKNEKPVRVYNDNCRTAGTTT